MKLSDGELEALLDQVESDRVERKESWSGSAPEKARQAICAFANDLSNSGKPGILFVGAKDDGSPSGLSITDELLQTLSDIKTDGKIVPPPSISVERRVLKGKPMAVVMALPSDSPPVRYEGRIWIRIGPRRGLASAQDERILNEKRIGRDLPFDIRPLPSCPPTELNRHTFESEYLPNAFARDVLEANERTYEERLQACRMISVVKPYTSTPLGVMCLAHSPRDWLPGFYIEFIRFAGFELSDAIADHLTIDGPLSQLLRRVDDKIISHIRTRVDLTSHITERRTPDYPLAALQQVIRNAVMHRTYESTNAPCRVYWFDDRIEVWSPGGPFGIVTKENFGKPGFTDYRNPHLAEAMRVLGFVQRFGVGIATAQRALAENGNPPLEYILEDTAIIATIRARA